MRLLQRSFEVETRYGGGFVQSIDGVGGGRERRPPGRLVLLRQRHRGGQRRRRAAASRRRPHLVGPPRLGRGDAHPGRRRLVPRAVPVRHEGKRLPMRIECARRRPARVHRGREAARGRGRARRRAVGDRRRTTSREVLRILVGPLGRGPRRPRGALHRERARRRPASSPGRRPTGDASSCSTPRGRVACDARRRHRAHRRDEPPSTSTPIVGRDRHRRAGVDAAAAALRRGRACATASRSRSRAAGDAVPAAARRSDGDRELPPPREPAARRARGRRRRCTAWCWPAWRCRFEHPLLLGAVLVAVLLAARRRGRRRRGRALAAVGAAVRAADRAGQPARRARGPDRDRAARRAAAVRRRSTSRSRRRSTARILGLRALIVIACFALHSAAVDPDELLRAFRRVSFRSALTAALATRMVPVLARDARRVARRPALPAGRARARGAAIAARRRAGALDRAVDVAATLEVRGYGGRPPAAAPARPWSRHDLAFAAVGGRARGARDRGGRARAGSRSRPTRGRWRRSTRACCALAAALVACALLPFADRRGIGR